MNNCTRKYRRNRIRCFILFSYIIVVCNFFAVAQYLEISENRRFLVTDKGKPFFWLGDTAWELIHKLDSTQVESYIQNRKAKGFNIFQTVIVSPQNGLQGPNAYEQLPFINLDPNKPNEAFFKYVDFIVDKAAEQNLYVALEPTWALYVIDMPQFNNVHIFTPENAKVYGEFLGKRYKEKWNVVWMLGGDTDPTKEGRIDIWESIAQGIKLGNKNKQLITYQPSGYASSADYIHEKEWLDFNGIQVGHARTNNIDADFVRRSWEKSPPKPVLNLESTYEGIGIGFKDQNGYFNAFDVRKSAYWSVFSGSLGYTYGHHAIWQMHEIGERYQLSNPKISWETALDAPGSFQMGYLRKLIESRPQLNRHPDPSIILAAHEKEPRWGQQSDRLVSLNDGSKTDSADASYILVYTPMVKELRVNTKIINDKDLKVWWFDPRNGSAKFAGDFSNTGDLAVGPPENLENGSGGPDWILVIDSAKKRYGPPGESSLEDTIK